MILTDSEIKGKNLNTKHGVLTSYITNDGSCSLINHYYQESFHSKYGALQEAKNKFLMPSELHRFSTREKVKILDVCVGMGYNSACIMEKLIQDRIDIEWWGLEVDKRPLSIALASDIFIKNWSEDILQVLRLIYNEGYIKNDHLEAKILWGDARKKIFEIPKDKKFDLILLDAFSPSKCPQLWTKEFLESLSNKLNTEGKLITYCTAAAIRKTLRELGLSIASLGRSYQENRSWSTGTIAMPYKNNYKQRISFNAYQPLTKMEEEHLQTLASIPYRDKSGESSSKEIINARIEEQKSSNLESTSSWKRRWERVKSSKDS